MPNQSKTSIEHPTANALLALDPNSDEKFNTELFKRLGDLGLLGVTVPPEYGGSGMDASAACIVHEELSAADPAFCLSYLGEYSKAVYPFICFEYASSRLSCLPLYKVGK